MDPQGGRVGWSRLKDPLSRKNLQPRIALLLLLGGSFTGIWLSHLGRQPAIRLYWWAVILTTAVLAGGLYWRMTLFDSREVPESTTDHWIRSRWRQLETGAIWLFALCGGASFGLTASTDTGGVGVLVVGMSALLTPVLWLGMQKTSSAPGSGRTRHLRWFLLALLLAALGGFAWFETGTDLFDWAVRVGHVGAFALWIGGAVWHNFVFLPAIRSATDPAAHRTRARRVRRHLPVIIAVLLLTGVVQALALVDLSFETLVDSPVGRLIGIKLLVLLALTGLVVAQFARVALTN